ncbi:hypothetical protein KIN20_023777 [Parelaphostrongylus tenuis]|uniref:Uncharacterized protein n=1 Tax=Parelaphostrongylus tenuis TaxID=148309 RepID=A0AAD5MSF0_PARTN|nr:hypothetical protein KIN20_023777 [Parelaphostrongylus tenuis]
MILFRIKRVKDPLRHLKKPEKIKDQPRRRHPRMGAEYRICCYLVDDLTQKMNMIILANKAGPSSAPFMILLLVSISTVFGCGVIPGGQTSTRTFTASGPSNLPIIAVYTNNHAVSALVPGIATSEMLFRH